MARDPESWIWEQAFLFVKTVRLEQHFLPLRGECLRGPVWEPPYDMFEIDHRLWVLVAMPGVEPERAGAAIEGRSLIVRGERVLPPELRGALVHRLEIPYGRLERRIELPSCRFRMVEHELALGCLAVQLERV